VTTPCERCKANRLECVIGSSNRGGRRVRKRTLEQAGLDEDAGAEPDTPGDVTSFEALVGASGIAQLVSPLTLFSGLVC
jgi:hypothetical protein